MDDLRKQLDEIDEKMRELFEARLNLAKKVGAYKKEKNLSILDKDREAQILKMHLDKLRNVEYKDYYTAFIKLLMDQSKDLQKKID